MTRRCILGLLVSNRVQNVPDVQKMLTECGCSIRTRLGLHDTDADFCSHSGLIILELHGDDAAYEDVEKRLAAIQGLQVQKMIFEE